MTLDTFSRNFRSKSDPIVTSLWQTTRVRYKSKKSGQTATVMKPELLSISKHRKFIYFETPNNTYYFFRKLSELFAKFLLHHFYRPPNYNSILTNIPKAYQQEENSNDNTVARSLKSAMNAGDTDNIAVGAQEIK